jgi:hypothetical protein
VPQQLLTKPSASGTIQRILFEQRFPNQRSQALEKKKKKKQATRRGSERGKIKNTAGGKRVSLERYVSRE